MSATITNNNILTVTQPGVVRVRATVADGSCLGDYTQEFDITFSNPTTPPPVPTGLICTGVASTTVSLSWNSAAGAASYQIQYKLRTASSWNTVNGITAITRTITGLSKDNEYEFQIRAVNSIGNSNWSTSIYATPENKLNTPTISYITQPELYRRGSLNVHWTLVSNANSYTIRYGTSENNLNVSFSIGNVQSTTISGLADGTLYYVQVKASGNGYTDSDWSTVVSCRTEKIRLDTPTLTVTTALNSTDITISWTSVQRASNYEVYYSPFQMYDSYPGTFVNG